jgi:3-mercaptopyruvate sulfurtransferase SseA
VAQKLHDQYGYSYDNLKVLLGGWNGWLNAGYPTEGTGPAPQDSGGVITNTIPLTSGNTIVITP